MIEPGSECRQRADRLAPMSTPALSVVVPNYRRPDLLMRCLESLRDSCRSPQMQVEVIVVDDGSRDESCQLVRASFPEFILESSRVRADRTRPGSRRPPRSPPPASAGFGSCLEVTPDSASHRGTCSWGRPPRVPACRLGRAYLPAADTRSRLDHRLSLCPRLVFGVRMRLYARSTHPRGLWPASPCGAWRRRRCAPLANPAAPGMKRPSAPGMKRPVSSGCREPIMMGSTRSSVPARRGPSRLVLRRGSGLRSRQLRLYRDHNGTLTSVLSVSWDHRHRRGRSRPGAARDRHTPSHGPRAAGHGP